MPFDANFTTPLQRAQHRKLDLTIAFRSIFTPDF